LLHIFGEPHIINSYKNLAALTLVISNITKHLKEYKPDAVNESNNSSPSPMPIDSISPHVEQTPTTMQVDRDNESNNGKEEKHKNDEIEMIDCPPLPIYCLKNLLDVLQHPAWTGRTLDKLIMIINRVS